MIWSLSHRADPWACGMADRHYNRQKIGSPQFVPPGRCIVLRAETETGPALWTTSWPFAEYVKHAWAGAWVNSLFRSEGAGQASDLILQAIAATRFFWEPPALGMVTFVDPKAVPGVKVRGRTIYGFGYLKAGFKHVGFTKGGLWTWQLLPDEMPDPEPAHGMQLGLIA
jgi:hypothetical protein